MAMNTFEALRTRRAEGIVVYELEWTISLHLHRYSTLELQVAPLVKILTQLGTNVGDLGQQFSNRHTTLDVAPRNGYLAISGEVLVYSALETHS
jgi:hypothetical protein